MPGTKAGAAKSVAKIKEKYGKDHYKTIGKRGAASYNSIPKELRKPRGFSVMSRSQRVSAGRRGGTIKQRNRKEEDGQ